MLIILWHDLSRLIEIKKNEGTVDPLKLKVTNSSLNYNNEC